MHEIGVDEFQAGRSPDRKFYRRRRYEACSSASKAASTTTDGSPTLTRVVSHYDGHLKLGLVDAEKRDLIEYLKSL